MVNYSAVIVTTGKRKLILIREDLKVDVQQAHQEVALMRCDAMDDQHKINFIEKLLQANRRSVVYHTMLAAVLSQDKHS